jgi:hypothetical protein
MAVITAAGELRQQQTADEARANRGGEAVRESRQ